VTCKSIYLQSVAEEFYVLKTFHGAYVLFFRRKVRQVLVNAATRLIRCVVDVVAHRTISRNQNVHNVDTPVVN
jgi:hypothetical protein